jgi:chaperonin cofactor prefoldin
MTENIYKDGNVSISQDKAPEQQDIVKEAECIYDKIQRNAPKGQDDEKLKEFQSELFQEHKAFFQTYPIVIRYMFLNYFDREPFNTWLESLKGKKWTDEDDYINSQAKYVKILMGYKNPKLSSSMLNQIKDKVATQLTEESSKFKTNIKVVEEKFKKTERRFKEEKREEIYRYIVDNQPQLKISISEEKALLPKTKALDL